MAGRSNSYSSSMHCPDKLLQDSNGTKHVLYTLGPRLLRIYCSVLCNTTNPDPNFWQHHIEPPFALPQQILQVAKIFSLRPPTFLSIKTNELTLTHVHLSLNSITNKPTLTHEAAYATMPPHLCAASIQEVFSLSRMSEKRNGTH